MTAPGEWFPSAPSGPHRSFEELVHDREDEAQWVEFWALPGFTEVLLLFYHTLRLCQKKKKENSEIHSKIDTYVLFRSTQRELKSWPLRQQRLQLLLADWLVLPPVPDVKMTSSWDIIQSTRWPQRYLQVNSTHPEASKPSGKVLAARLAGNQAASRSPLSLTWVLGCFWEAETVHGWDLTSFRHFREQETWAEVQVFSKTERYVSKALGVST